MLKSAGINAATIAAANTPSTPSLVTKLVAVAIPFVIAPTGTMANNGAITLGTALPTTYANCYINLPANAISAGSAAGWYFCQMSSATVGTVFNNTYTSGTPAIPASPTAFVTTGPGAYTGVTGTVNAQAISIPANTLGANGVLSYQANWSFPSNGNNKTASITFGGSAVLSNTQTTQATLSVKKSIQNRGATNAQFGDNGTAGTGVGTSGNSNAFLAVDTTTALTLQFASNIAVATDYMVMESFVIEVLPG
jgi:hypothetical protein